MKYRVKSTLADSIEYTAWTESYTEATSWLNEAETLYKEVDHSCLLETDGPHFKLNKEAIDRWYIDFIGNNLTKPTFSKD
jgi:hypothetical protein